jgi:hypothetical protein
VPGRAPSAPRLPLDPIAFPGVQAVESTGLRLPAGAVEEPRDAAAAGALPPVLTPERVVGNRRPYELAVPDAYSLRLVAQRRLYDRGAAVEASPSLRTLVETAVLRANPYDLDRIGAADGAEVRVQGAGTAMVLRCDADAGVPRGSLCVGLNLDAPGAARAASGLVSAGRVVTEVRMESL